MFFPVSRNEPSPTHQQERAIAKARLFARMRRVDLQAHRDRLLRSALLLCGNETEAEDLVQETFLRALESARQFRGDSTVHTWLHGILLNLRHRRIREQKRLVVDGELVSNGTIVPS